jgi:hypothetical protein
MVVTLTLLASAGIAAGLPLSLGRFHPKWANTSFGAKYGGNS